MTEIEELRKDAAAFRRLVELAGEDQGEYVRRVALGSPRPIGNAWQLQCDATATYKTGAVLRSTLKWVDKGDMPTFGDFLRSLREDA